MRRKVMTCSAVFLSAVLVGLPLVALADGPPVVFVAPDADGASGGISVPGKPAGPAYQPPASSGGGGSGGGGASIGDPASVGGSGGGGGGGGAPAGPPGLPFTACGQADGTAGAPQCQAAPPPPAGQPAAPAPPPPPNAAQLAQAARASIKLPGASPVIEPDPGRNKWKMVAVGYPLWLHVGGATQLNANASVAGYTLTLQAQRTGVHFDMGDGSGVDCVETTPWDGNAQGNPSPTCGYTYGKKSLPEGSYTVTATSTWTINWAGAGQSGSFQMNQSGSTALPVGELSAVVVK